MAKYLVTWEGDTDLPPDDPRSRGELIIKMLEATKQAIKDGQVSDWGQFIGGGKGYGIAEGDAVEVFKTLQQWAPYVNFKVQEVLSVDECIKAVKSLTG